MIFSQISLTIPDIDADTPHQAAAMFLDALVSADWTGGLQIRVEYENDAGEYVDETVTLSVTEVESILR